MSSPDDLSYSIFLDRIRSDQGSSSQEYTLNHVRPKNNPVWVPDSAAIACHLCKNSFTFYRRVHHCRLCGFVFCNSCSYHFIHLSKNLETIPECSPEYKTKWTLNFLWRSKVYSKQKERVCDTCYARYTEMQKLEVYILLFGYLDIKTLLSIATISKQWNQAVNVIKSMFRDIQYSLPGYTISPIQKQILWSSRHYLAGHSRWMVKLLTFTDWSSVTETVEAEECLHHSRACKCWSLMCTRRCQPQLTGYDCIELLTTKITSPDVISYIRSCMDHLSTAEFECYIPQMTFNLRSSPWLLETLIHRSLDDNTIRTIAYWNLSLLKSRDPFFHLMFNTYMSRLHDALGKKVVFGELIQGRRFIKILSKIPSNGYNEYLQKNKEYLPCGIRYSPNDPIRDPPNEIALPSNPNLTIKMLDAYGIKTKDSATAPMVIPLICSNNTHNRIEQSLLYKKECLIQDYIIVNIIRLMDIILKRDLDIDFGIRTYQVLPLDEKGGVIEIVPEAETLYSIKYHLNFTLLNYLLEHNPQLSITEIRDRFTKSASAYCVISYLLGIGDRHQDNVMLQCDGYLFHIDYSYILGFDPKPLTPAIRITTEMIDVLGGVNSRNYQSFKTYCTQIYNCLRKYTSVFMSMLMIITEDGLNLDPTRYTRERLKEEILSRFVPSESAQDAEMQLLIKIDDSHRSTTPRLFIDFWHYHAKETLSKILPR